MTSCPYQQPEYRTAIYTLKEVQQRQCDAYQEGVEAGTRVMRQNYEVEQKLQSYGD